MFVKPKMTLFEQLKVLQEAPGDDNNATNVEVDQNTTNTDPNAGEAENTQDDDLNVDVDLNLDDPGTGGDDNQDQGGGTTDDLGGDMGGGGGDDFSSTASTDSGDDSEEVKKGNTDIFSSLTAEEQSIKIMELKRLYNELYTSLDDLINKLSDIALEDIDPRITVRITSQMEELRRILQDYIINVFSIKTYYENDVQYTIFLNMFTTLRGVFDDLYKNKEQNRDKK